MERNLIRLPHTHRYNLRQVTTRHNLPPHVAMSQESDPSAPLVFSPVFAQQQSMGSNSVNIGSRSRSYSESQKPSSRAEKRMGRLFRQNSTVATHSPTLPQQPIATHNESNLEDRLEFAIDTKHSHSSSLGSNTTAVAVPPPPTTTSASTSASTSTSSSTSASSTNRRKYENVSSPELSFNHAGNDSSTNSTVVAENSSIPDQTISTTTTTDNITDILHLSKQFVFVYFQFMTTVQSLNVNVSLPTTNFDVLIEVIGTADKKINSSNSSFTDQDANIKSHLTSSLAFSVADLRKILASLRSVIKSKHSSLSPFSLRTAFYSLFSMFVELSNIAHSIIFLSKSKKSRSKSTDVINNGFGHLRNNSQSHKLRSADSTLNMPFIHTMERQDSDLSSSGLRDADISSSVASASGANLISESAPTPGVSSSQTAPTSFTEFSSKPSNDENESLFKLIDHTIQSALTVYSEMNNAIAKSAVTIATNTSTSTNENLNTENKENTADVASKIKELTTQCLTSMEQTKRVKTCLNMLENTHQNQLNDVELNKNVYEQTNIFLKSIICILAATKSAIDVIPSLNDVRSSLSILTRASKELTIKLESSTLKQYVLTNTPSSTVLIDQPKLSSIPSMSNVIGDSSRHINQNQTQNQNIDESDSTSSLQQKKTSVLNKIPEQDESLAGVSETSPLHSSSSSSSKPMNLASTTSGVGPAPKRQNMHLDIKPIHMDQESMMKSPLAVTTPLIASIGPAVASAVLPAKSPLKLSSNVSGGFPNTNSNTLNTHNHISSSNNIDEALLRHEIDGSSTPSYYMNGNFTNVANGSGQSQQQGGNNNNNSMDMEYNPFENLVSRE